MTRETKDARRERLQRQRQALANDASPGRRALYLCGECNVLHWVTCVGIGSFDPHGNVHTYMCVYDEDDVKDLYHAEATRLQWKDN